MTGQGYQHVTQVSLLWALEYPLGELAIIWERAETPAKLTVSSQQSPGNAKSTHERKPESFIR